MTRRPNPALQFHSTVDTRFAEAIESAKQLCRSVRTGRLNEADIRAVEGRLDTLPLQSDDYAWLRNRLRNARLYHFQGEVYAAAYEIAFVAKRLVRLRSQ